MSDHPEEIERELNLTRYLGQQTGLEKAAGHVMGLAQTAFANRREEADLLRRTAEALTGMADEAGREADKHKEPEA